MNAHATGSVDTAPTTADGEPLNPRANPRCERVAAPHRFTDPRIVSVAGHSDRSRKVLREGLQRRLERSLWQAGSAERPAEPNRSTDYKPAKQAEV
jgi:hypothetical protein